MIGDIYPPELVLKETTEKSGLASYLDVGKVLEMDSTILQCMTKGIVLILKLLTSLL